MKKNSLAIVSTLIFFLITACSERITPIKITASQHKEKCGIATDNYEIALKAYNTQLKSSLSQTGQTINHNNLNTAVRESVKLRPYIKEKDDAKSSQKFWCEKVKLNSTIYEKDGKIFLTLKEAKDYKN